MLEPSRKAKIIWQCRRGMLELDLILNPFASNALEQLNEASLQAFERLLSSPDPVLYSWLMGSTDPDDKELRVIVELVRRYADTH